MYTGAFGSARKQKMRVLPFMLIAGSLATCPRLAYAEGLRLEDAVRLALDNNERARKAPYRVDAASGQLDKARGAFFPTLTAAGSEQYQAQADKTGRHATTAGSVTLTQPLLNPSAFPSY